MEQITHRTVEVNGIRMHIAEQGTAGRPVVLLLHGFPSLWYCWRHQMPALARAGYHVVAPDMRGFGQTEAPAEPGQYSIMHIVGDVVNLVESVLGEKQVYVVGHDWGAITAWYTALLRPDLVKCVVALSFSFISRHPKYSVLELLRAQVGEQFYMVQWQEPGKAERDLSKDVKLTFEKYYGSKTLRSGEFLVAKDGKSVMDSVEAPEALPSWISEQDIEYYVKAFSKTGFTPGLNWYRNLQTNWEMTAPWTGKGTSVAALMVIGDLDLSIKLVRPYVEGPQYKSEVPNGEFKIVPGLAHSLPEEAPALVNGFILELLERHK